MNLALESCKDIVYVRALPSFHPLRCMHREPIFSGETQLTPTLAPCYIMHSIRKLLEEHVFSTQSWLGLRLEHSMFGHC